MNAPTQRHEKVTARHQERWAYVYVRQSTPRQVREHRAGRENQDALVDRALALGWPRDRIRVIDIDLDRARGTRWPASRLSGVGERRLARPRGPRAGL